MQVTLTEAARAFLAEGSQTAVTVASLVISSCCAGPLSPEVQAGAPADPDGFAQWQAGEIAIFYDSLLPPRPAITIDLKDYGRYRQLFVEGWE